MNDNLVVRHSSSHLPDLIWVHVFSFCTARDICCIAVVCKHWRVLQQDERIWEALYMRSYGVGGSAPNNWKVECKIGKNWTTTNYKELILRAHYQPITSVKLVENQTRVISASLDSNLRVHDVQSGKNLGIIRGHQAGINCLNYHPLTNTLVSGSKDRTVRLWDLTAGMQVRSLPFKTSEVLCAQSDESKILAGGTAGLLKLFDMRQQEPVEIPFEHRTSAVRCLQFDQATVVVGTEAGKIRALDLRTGKCIQSYEEHSRYVSCLQFNEKTVISGSPDWSIKIWDRQTGECIQELKEHMEGVWCLKFDGQRLLTGGGDGNAKVWDMREVWCVNTLKAHTGTVTCLDFDRHTLVTGGSDQVIRVWDFSDPSYRKPASTLMDSNCSVQ